MKCLFLLFLSVITANAAYPSYLNFNTNDFRISEFQISINPNFLTEGPAGNDGTNGVDGPQGIQGPAGNDGTNGATGATGSQGLPGTNGAAGINGTNGATGPQGPQGIQGTQGNDGANGTNGVDGAQGPQGIQGVAGANGTNGATGTQGIQGPQGTAGVNGTNGVDGQPGTFAVAGWGLGGNTNGQSVTLSLTKTNWSIYDVTNAGYLPSWSLLPTNTFLGLHAKSDTAGTADTALAGWPTTWGFSSVIGLGTAARSNSSAFYLSSNPSSYITLADVPAQRTQWSLSDVTNAGYLPSWSILPTNSFLGIHSTADAASSGWPTSWLVSQISNAGTAAYSNAAAFLTPAQVGTAAYSNTAAFVHPADIGTAAYSNSTAFLTPTSTLNGTNLAGTITNNTTGNAATATFASFISGSISNSITGNASTATVASFVSGTLSNSITGNSTTATTANNLDTSATLAAAQVTNALPPILTNSVKATAVGAVIQTAAGSALTNLNATELRSGTVADARFPANLPVPTNSPTANQVVTASSATSSKWATPSASSTVFQNASGGINTLAYNTTASYYGPYSSAAGNATEAKARVPWSVTSTFTNLYIYLSTTPGAGTNLTVTVFTNGVASNLSVSVLNPATTASNTSSGVPVTAGTQISIKQVGNNSSASANSGLGWSFQYY